MKTPKFNMGGFLKGVSIVMAAGSLVTAIFSKDDTEKLNKIDELEKRINSLEKK